MSEGWATWILLLGGARKIGISGNWLEREKVYQHKALVELTGFCWLVV